MIVIPSIRGPIASSSNTQPLPVSIIISEAGSSYLDGTYNWTGITFNNKRVYTSVTESTYTIFWNASLWVLYDDNLGSVMYTSDNLIEWNTTGGTGSPPAPTGTLVY